MVFDLFYLHVALGDGYRMARTPSGPWIVPQPDDLFEGRTFYAAKTVFDGSRRLIVGWTA